MPGGISNRMDPVAKAYSFQSHKIGLLQTTANYIEATQMKPLLNSTENMGKSEITENETKYSIPNWSVDEVVMWARSLGFSNDVINCLQIEKIDGEVLLALCENDIRDMRYRLNYQLTFADLIKLWFWTRDLQEHHQVHHQRPTGKDSVLIRPDYECSINAVNSMPNDATPIHRRHQTIETLCCQHVENRETHTVGCYFPTSDIVPNSDSDVWTPPTNDGCAANIPPEFFKTFISLGYSFLVTWITSFVMVIVHERVPDMKRYPPLPDIFLDNVPHIPWAFHMCEITGTLLFAIWSCVCIFHKYRMVLLRRFFALAGTVFLLRCVTMLITSLSVPGTHLQCDQSDYAVDDTDLTLTEALELRISRAYIIWSGLGMSIQGVRTCGDYMFSGHTVALTLLNFFITEYTPRNLYFLHTLTWLLNMFGIFFILAAHEHYSIDVFVAFYITSRLFLYYHTLANNQALMSRDSTRTRIWFPMFSYFESSVDGIIPNEFDTVSTLLDGLLRLVLEVKDSCMQSAQRFTVDPPHFALATKNLLLLPVSKQHRHASTSTHSTVTAPTVNFQSTATPMSSDLAESNTTVTGQFENANGNASGEVTFSKATPKLPKDNSGPNHNNNNSVESSSQPTALVAEKRQTKTTADRDLSYKVLVDNKKQL